MRRSTLLLLRSTLRPSLVSNSFTPAKYALSTPPLAPTPPYSRPGPGHRISRALLSTISTRENKFIRSANLLEASSLSTPVLLLALLCAAATTYSYLSYSSNPTTNSPNQAPAIFPSSSDHPLDPFHILPDMPILPGHRGNLTPEQEAHLRHLWALTLKTFGVEDPTPRDNGETNGAGGAVTPEPTTEASAEGTDPSTKNKKKSRLSIFGRNKHDTHTGTSATTNGSPSSSPRLGDNHHDTHLRTDIDQSDDKFGQVKEFQHIIATQSPESLRVAFWSMVKKDHPDALLLRFLRARKWDVDKALVMMISTMAWRSKEMKVDEDIMFNGEGDALKESLTGKTEAEKREGRDFLAQLRMGKSFIHGVDKEGRPICLVRARLHRGGEQTERSLERYTVYLIETARLVLKPPVETATIMFDMTHFTMANMDYTPVKFMIKVFEANYPESLGCVLVHKAPWIFQGIWKIIRGWLDPVVASKVHFTNSVEDLEVYIEKGKIIKELGGVENWEYEYVEPKEGENEIMKDVETRTKLEAERNADVLEYQKQTFDYIHHHTHPATNANANANGEAGEGEGVKISTTRDEIARRLNENYWRLDPYLRARSLYDRTGVLGGGGVIEYYPTSGHGQVGGGEMKKNGVGVGAVGHDDGGVD